MCDDTFSDGDGATNDEVTYLTSVSRSAAVTDSLNTIFSLLSDSRRRYLLYFLFSVDANVVELEDAVYAVYEYEEISGDTSHQMSRKEIRISLHHNHLPYLADEGILEYDSRQETIRFTEAPALEEWTEHARYQEIE